MTIMKGMRVAAVQVAVKTILPKKDTTTRITTATITSKDTTMIQIITTHLQIIPTEDRIIISTGVIQIIQAGKITTGGMVGVVDMVEMGAEAVSTEGVGEVRRDMYFTEVEVERKM